MRKQNLQKPLWLSAAEDKEEDYHDHFPAATQLNTQQESISCSAKSFRADGMMIDNKGRDQTPDKDKRATIRMIHCVIPADDGLWKRV